MPSTAEAVAAQIVALINSSPRSPREDQLVAILAPYMNGTPGEIAPTWLPPLAEVEAAIAACEAVAGEDTDESDRAGMRLDELTDKVWAAPPTSRAALRGFALIAQHWHRKDAKTMDGEKWATPSDYGDVVDHAVAALIEAVLAYSRGVSSSQTIVPAPAMPAPALLKGVHDVGMRAFPAVTPLNAAHDTYLASAWYHALEEFLEASSHATIEEEDALYDRRDSVIKAICAKPVRTPDDLVVRAAIAAHWYGDEIRNPSFTEAHVLAAVVRGVLDLAGLKFDAEGRLLDAGRTGQ
jgi:hypothetical protein